MTGSDRASGNFNILRRLCTMVLSAIFYCWLPIQDISLVEIPRNFSDKMPKIGILLVFSGGGRESEIAYCLYAAEMLLLMDNER